MSGGMERNGGRSAWFTGYLVFTAVVCGALVMVVEVLGSRVIGPHYGVSLFVWTSLISVTLVALALGYAAGGVLSDRKEGPDWLYAVILAAGILVLLVPAARIPVLKACRRLGLRTGALASSAILFGPPLFFLGCVSPFLVKIAAREMRSLGRTVGIFYAISTAGSFLGTVLAGFVLLAYFGVNRIFSFVGILLLCLGAAYFLFFRRKWVFLGLLAVPLLLPSPHPARSGRLRNGTKATEIFNRDGFYGNVRVVDTAFGNPSEGALVEREMTIDGLVQGGVDLENGLPVYRYFYLMEFLPYALNPSGKECLVIGLGAGIIPMWYEARGIRTDVVDINPDVVEAARKHFGFRNSGEVHVADARCFLEGARKAYDFIILDVFNGDTSPAHVLTVEALGLMKARLARGGVLAINLIGSIREEPFMTASVVRTLESVFRTVEVHPLLEAGEGEGWGNLAILAHDGPRAPFRGNLVGSFPVHPMAASAKRRMRNEFRFPPGTPAIVLTDDYAPLDFFDLRLKEKLRDRILSNAEWDLET